jgi:hypothetical protein
MAEALKKELRLRLGRTRRLNDAVGRFLCLAHLSCLLKQYLLPHPRIELHSAQKNHLSCSVPRISACQQSQLTMHLSCAAAPLPPSAMLPNQKQAARGTQQAETSEYAFARNHGDAGQLHSRSLTIRICMPRAACCVLL